MYIKKITARNKKHALIDVYNEKEGKTVKYTIRTPGIRLIIPTAHNTFLMNYEYRGGLQKWDYRLPGGKVYDTLDEFTYVKDEIEYNALDLLPDAQKAAVLEAKQEIGITTHVDDLELLEITEVGGSTKHDIYYFLVKKYELGDQELEPDEQIERVELTSEEIMEKIYQKEFSEDRSIGPFLRFIKKHSIS